jgi:cyclic pyranopterin phosphate synthase
MTDGVHDLNFSVPEPGHDKGNGLGLRNYWPRLWATGAERRVADLLGRPLKDLRLSVTDRCNLRCTYCMPEDDYTWLPPSDILTFEEISSLVDVFVSLGVDKVRITGGEPLLRKNLSDLVRMLAAKPRVADLAMTTNGVLLAQHARTLRDAGLGRVTVSLDTLRPERFELISQRRSHPQVLDGLRAVTQAGFVGTKIDTVVIRGINDDELVDLIEFARSVHAEVRFIEYMDVGGATRWNPASVFSRVEMLQCLKGHYGEIEALEERDSSPATRFGLPDGTIFGIVSSTTQPFCATCDRSRVTADGMWYRCLYARTGTDLRQPLRSGAGFEQLREIVTEGWEQRRDQGAVDRLARKRRRPLLPVTVLKTDPHLEMHTRGG